MYNRPGNHLTVFIELIERKVLIGNVRSSPRASLRFLVNNSKAKFENRFFVSRTVRPSWTYLNIYYIVCTKSARVFSLGATARRGTIYGAIIAFSSRTARRRGACAVRARQQSVAQCHPRWCSIAILL